MPADAVRPSGRSLNRAASRLIGGRVGRDVHLEDFDRLAGMLASMSRAATGLIDTANTALLGPDVDAGQRVLTMQASLVADTHRFDAFVPEVLARRQPVASDMRLVLAGIRINADIERMAALGAHIAKIALSRFPQPAVPEPALAIIAGMAAAASSLSNKSATTLATRNPIDAMQVAIDDDEPDALQVQLYAMLAEGWGHGVQAAIDLAMLGRFYERFADHAVSVAQQVVYIVRGNVASTQF
jgi:phosphate transport system protein